MNVRDYSSSKWSLPIGLRQSAFYCKFKLLIKSVVVAWHPCSFVEMLLYCSFLFCLLSFCPFLYCGFCPSCSSFLALCLYFLFPPLVCFSVFPAFTFFLYFNALFSSFSDVTLTFLFPFPPFSSFLFALLCIFQLFLQFCIFPRALYPFVLFSPFTIFFSQYFPFTSKSVY